MANRGLPPLARFEEDEEIRNYIFEKTGDLGLSVCQLIEDGVFTIIELAEAMKMPRRATRQVLYALNKERIIGYKRVRKERKIIFHWFLTPKKIKRMISAARRNEIRMLEEEIEHEQDHKFFTCFPCGERYLYTEAFEYEFTCEQCGEPLKHDDNTEKIKMLRAKLEELIEAENLSRLAMEEEAVQEEEGDQDIRDEKDLIEDELEDEEEERPKKKKKKKRKRPKEKEPDKDPLEEEEEEGLIRYGGDEEMEKDPEDM
jgi:transcription factor E